MTWKAKVLTWGHGLAVVEYSEGKPQTKFALTKGVRNRSLMISFRRSDPRMLLATSAPREVAIVKTVTSRVTAAQSHALSRPCRHEVSSLWAEATSRTC